MKIYIKNKRRRRRRQEEGGGQMGQVGVCSHMAPQDDAKVVQRGFKERKVDSLKVITCHKLPGQQA